MKNYYTDDSPRLINGNLNAENGLETTFVVQMSGRSPTAVIGSADATKLLIKGSNSVGVSFGHGSSVSGAQSKMRPKQRCVTGGGISAPYIG